MPDLSAGVAHRAGWTGALWSRIDETFEAILRHPFIIGLTDGSLDPAAFTHFLAQDSHYLRCYSRVLSLVAAKASDPQDTAMFSRHAAGAVEVEIHLHTRLLGALGVDPAAVATTPVSPTTVAYTSYLLATAYAGSYTDGVAAVLPCYWIYAEVGRALGARGSPDPRYQRWIDTYAGDEFQAVVSEVLVTADRIGAVITSSEADHAAEHFVVTSRYEWMFWDAAFRRETWPV